MVVSRTVPAVMVLARLLQAHDGGDSSSRKRRRYVILRIDFSARPLHGEAVISHPAAVHAFERIGAVFLQQPVFVAAALAAFKCAHNTLSAGTPHTNGAHRASQTTRSRQQPIKTLRT